MSVVTTVSAFYLPACVMVILYYKVVIGLRKRAKLVLLYSKQIKLYHLYATQAFDIALSTNGIYTFISTQNVDAKRGIHCIFTI